MVVRRVGPKTILPSALASAEVSHGHSNGAARRRAGCGGGERRIGARPRQMSLNLIAQEETLCLLRADSSAPGIKSHGELSQMSIDAGAHFRRRRGARRQRNEAIHPHPSHDPMDLIETRIFSC